jgi:CRP-like cAMP-binding protein
MNKEKLYRSFDKYLSLSEAECADLGNRVTERKLKRKQYLLQEGEICRQYYFVAEGCFRVFHVDAKGVEHNLQFVGEGDWIMEIDSFYEEKPGKVFVQASEPSAVLQLKKPDLLHLFVTNPKFDRNFRVIVERRYVELENRMLQSISASTEERYLSFIRTYPKLANNIPNSHIASYLGITAEFLSKVRKKIAYK